VKASRCWSRKVSVLNNNNKAKAQSRKSKLGWTRWIDSGIGRKRPDSKIEWPSCRVIGQAAEATRWVSGCGLGRRVMDRAVPSMTWATLVFVRTPESPHGLSPTLFVYHDMSAPTTDISQLSQEQQLALQQVTSVTDQDLDAALALLQRCQWNAQVHTTPHPQPSPPPRLTLFPDRHHALLRRRR
jgi:hypothetical protein